MEPVFSEDEVARLELAHPQGLPAGAMVEMLRQRGVGLTEATFRKYVQLGLLPRSRRVGRKGKHRGSHGLYPAACLRRIEEIRGLMEEGLTLEEIRASALAVGVEVDQLRRAAEAVLGRLEKRLAHSRSPGAAALARRVDALRTRSHELADALEGLTRAICVPAPATEPDPAALARQAEQSLRRLPARAARSATQPIRDARSAPGTKERKG